MANFGRHRIEPGAPGAGRTTAFRVAPRSLSLACILMACPSLDSELLVQRLDTVVEMPVELDYSVSFPAGYGEDPDARWPLLVFLHGSGERGSDISKVALHGPLKEIGKGRELPFIIVAPQCPDGEWWRPHWVRALVEEAAVRYRVDRARIYLTGLSMGGFGTWMAIAEYPDLFAAAAPVCGGGMPYRADRFARVPVWAFHGERDSVVPVAESERMVAALEKAGGEVRFTRYPDADHDSWTATYANPELYSWLLTHRRDD